MKNNYLKLFILLFCFIINAQDINFDEGKVYSSGVFEVSPTGASTYKLPIAIPSGIDNVAPTISLVYNSQSGNGIAGWGWNIQGLSTISKTSSTILHDGNIDPVDFDNMDRYSLDGQRLMLKSGTYGANNSIYQTESFSTTKITALGVHPLGASFGPAYFLVEAPNGIKTWYGNSSTSRNKLSWHINRVENANGVYIEYSYKTSNNITLISSIKYGSRGTTSAINSVDFFYKLKQRKEQSYITGTDSYVQTEILDRIETKTSTNIFRKYTMLYEVTSLNYERLKEIQEFNNANEKATPVVFNYQNTDNGLNENQDQIINNVFPGFDSEKDEYISGYFDEDSKLDFITYPKTKDKFNLFFKSEIYENNPINFGYTIESGSFDDIFSTKIIFASNNHYYNNDAITTISGGTLKTYIKNYPIGLLYTKNFTIPNTNPGKNFSGDFNGDGLSEVIAVRGGSSESEFFLLDLNKNNTSTSPLNLGKFSGISIKDNNNYTGDFDGDGANDIYSVKDGTVYVFGIVNNKITLKTTINVGNFKKDKPVFLADFNGDGKSDLITPNAADSKEWSYLISNGKSFNYIVKDIGIYWYSSSVVIGTHQMPDGSYLRGYMYDIVNYNFTDVNGDGKADFLYHIVTTPYNFPNDKDLNYPYRIYGVNYTIRDSGTLFYNMGNESDGTVSSFSKTDVWRVYHTYNGSKTKGTPIFLSDKNTNNQNLNYAYFGRNSIKYVSFKKDHRIDTQLKSISEKDNTIKTEITYKPLIEGTINGYIPLPYSSDNYKLSYPYVDINSIPALKIVDKIEISNGSQIKGQSFKYLGAVSHLQGLGFIGFKGIAKSSIYEVGKNESNITWSLTKSDPLKRNIPIEQWTSFSSSWYKYLPITSSIYTYDYSETNKIVRSLLKNTTTTTNEDFGSIATTEDKEYTTDGLFNIKKITSKVNNVINKVENFEYHPVINAPYLAGRLKSNTSTSYIDGNSLSSKIEFEYNLTNRFHLISKKRTYGNQITSLNDYVDQEYTYDIFGNLTSTKTTPFGMVPRSTSSAYDASGRFVVKSVNVEGIESEFIPGIFGEAKKITSFTDKTKTKSFSVTKEYDNWLRLKSETDKYGNISNIYYKYHTSTKSDVIQKISPSGAKEYDWFDSFGRKYQSTANAKNGKWVVSLVEYDGLDRVIKEYEPYFYGSTLPKFKQFTFDKYNRNDIQILPNGRKLTTTYNGLTTTTNDGIKITETTVDDLGNIKKLVEKSNKNATITYTYNANGEMKTADYGSYIVQSEIDNWGRKSKTIDPSAGTYEYKYTGFGELKTEITPKGTTEFTYDNFGKLKKKIIKGELTDEVTDYNYRPDLFLDSYVHNDVKNNNITTKSFSYDTWLRLEKVIEDNSLFMFENQFTYDNLGREKTILYKASVNKNTAQFYETTNSIRKEYSTEGIHDKIINHTTNKILWQLDDVSAKGKVLKSTLGNGIVRTNTFDEYGFAKEFNHTKNNVSVFKLNFNFDQQLGNLTNRTNHSFNYTESFKYDEINRLTEYTLPSGQQKMTYDERGRITSYPFSNGVNYRTGDQMYKLSNIPLVSAGKNYYETRSPQSITYNVYKKPIQIFEKDRDRIDFAYHENGLRKWMYYGNSNELVKENRPFVKFYSSDGSMEIKYNKDKTTEIITFVGGDAYSAPIYFYNKKTHNSTNQEIKTTNYIHRDYLGSINAISDETGKMLEERQFDAWGNLVKLKINGVEQNLSLLTTNFLLLIDRGYTGHEHLFSVGLINMNGRLYDPKLQRFLMPDNYVQDPFNTQNFNRYSYVMNNPLIYTDYTGEWFGWDDLVVAAVSFVVGYVSHGIATNDWGASAVKAGAISAVTGWLSYNTAGLSGSFNHTWSFLGNMAINTAINHIMPPLTFQFGNWSISMSPTIVIGGGNGGGMNLSVAYNDGTFGIAYGFGITQHQNYNGTGVSGVEFRNSFMGSYSDGTTTYSLGTNIYGGTGGMKQFAQRTGVIGIQSGDFRMMYENDGGAGVSHLRLGNRGDSYRTAGLTIGVGDFEAGLNLFTGKRSRENQSSESKAINERGKLINPITNQTDGFGRKYKRGFVNETGPKYRLGALTLGYKGYRFGVNSEHVRHFVQDIVIHGLIGDRGFENTSWNWNLYSQYKTPNSFTSW